MARRTKEEAEKTKEALLDAAERVFMTRGVAAASLDEIAKEAGLTRGAVYHHFDGKLAIFRAMHDRVKLPMDVMFETLVGADPLKGLKKMCVHVLQALERDARARNVFTIMRLRSDDYLCTNSEYVKEMVGKRQQVIEKFTRVFTKIAKQHGLQKGVTPAFAAIAMHSFISGVFWDYLRDPKHYPIAKLAPKLVECFFRGVVKEAA